jgi:hypothetical protein
MAMLIVTLVAAAAFLGGLLGGLVRRRLDRRRAEPVTVERFVIDPLATAEMDQAAAAWSQAHGRPEIGGLLADKLRLAYTLKHRPRPPEHRGRWGR